MGRLLVAFALAATVASGCGGEGSDTTDGIADDPGQAVADDATDAGEQRHPDVIAVEADPDDAGTWTFRVTISSPYDTPARYADGWRIVGVDGTVYGVHQLAHDHADEQPFTRTQRGVEIPRGVTEVVVEGRDQQYGFGGTSMTVTLARE